MKKEDTIKCPHCGNERNIEPESDYTNEDEEFNEECPECGKNYVITHWITHSWNVECAENEHDLIPSEKHEGWSDCSKCGGFIHMLPKIN